MLDILTEYFFGIFFIGVLLCIPILILSHFFYKGKIRTIKVIKLRSVTRDMVNYSPIKFNKSNYAEFIHKTVDFQYVGRKWIHTMNCGDDVFKKLHTGMVCRVRIRYNSIVAIYFDKETRRKRH